MAKEKKTQTLITFDENGEPIIPALKKQFRIGIARVADTIGKQLNEVKIDIREKSELMENLNSIIKNAKEFLASLDSYEKENGKPEAKEEDLNPEAFVKREQQ